MKGWRSVLALGMVLGLPSCASMVNSSAADIVLRTRPEPAHCTLTGDDGFSLGVDSPATVAVPRSAGSVTVTCVAPGYRRTVASLDPTADGWTWGNPAMVVMFGGVAMLGLAVDGATGRVWDYRDLTVDLDPDRRRAMTVRDRATGTILRFGE